MLKSINTKLNAVLVVAVFAIAMTLGPAISNFQTAFATNGVDSEQCRDDEDYYEDNEKACDKDLRLHFGEDYDGDFGSKSIDDDDNDNDNDDNNGNGNSASQGIGQSQSSSQNSQCVSGGDTNDSCNNVSLQNQDNDGNNAAAQSGGDDDDDDDSSNRSNQGIGQSQSSRQNSQCVSGGDTNDSCNNVSLQNQDNDGNNAAAQSGGDDDDDDDSSNRSNQGIGQSQSSRQNSQCVSGGSLGNSCNNVSLQNQDNDGNNAAAQDGGNGKKGKGGNDADQGIGQDQDSEQNSQCVSGEDATVSCNNVSFQNQVNSGNNALAQQD